MSHSTNILIAVKNGLRNIHANGLEYACGALLFALTIVCSIQVVTRYFLITQWGGWAEELSRLFFIWGVFLGVVVAVKHQTLIGIDFLVKKFTKGKIPHTAVLLFQNVSMLILAAILFGYGLKYVIMTSGDHMTILGFPRNVFYLPAPLSGFLILIEILPRVIHYIRLISELRKI